MWVREAREWAKPMTKPDEPQAALKAATLLPFVKRSSASRIYLSISISS
jgi:hypothetical protein